MTAVTVTVAIDLSPPAASRRVMLTRALACSLSLALAHHVLSPCALPGAGALECLPVCSADIYETCSKNYETRSLASSRLASARCVVSVVSLLRVGSAAACAAAALPLPLPSALALALAHRASLTFCALVVVVVTAFFLFFFLSARLRLHLRLGARA